MTADDGLGMLAQPEGRWLLPDLAQIADRFARQWLDPSEDPSLFAWACPSLSKFWRGKALMHARDAGLPGEEDDLWMDMAMDGAGQSEIDRAHAEVDLAAPIVALERASHGVAVFSAQSFLAHRKSLELERSPCMVALGWVDLSPDERRAAQAMPAKILVRWLAAGAASADLFQGDPARGAAIRKAMRAHELGSMLADGVAWGPEFAKMPRVAASAGCEPSAVAAARDAARAAAVPSEPAGGLLRRWGAARAAALRGAALKMRPAGSAWGEHGRKFLLACYPEPELARAFDLWGAARGMARGGAAHALGLAAAAGPSLGHSEASALAAGRSPPLDEEFWGRRAAALIEAGQMAAVAAAGAGAKPASRL